MKHANSGWNHAILENNHANYPKNRANVSDNHANAKIQKEYSILFVKS